MKDNKASESYKHLCISHDLEGLRAGISSFSHPSRVALIYAVEPDDELRIYDPQALLRGHEPKLQELYLETTEWRQKQRPLFSRLNYEFIDFTSVELSGIIAYGGRSSTIDYQMWFTEHHPDICSIGPIQMWLEHAVRLLVQDIALANEINIGTSGYVLQGYALHAIRDYIVDKRNMLLGPDSCLHIYPILEIILEISRTKEEGVRPFGQLAIVEPGMIKDLQLQVKFSENERPLTNRAKYFRKLLQAVENSPYKLISDGENIIGISDSKLPPSTIIAQFQGNSGFVFLDDECICSFSNGNYHSTNRKAKMVHLEESLLEQPMQSIQRYTLFNTISSLVHFAQGKKIGCTLILDLNDPPMAIAGQKLGRPLHLTDPNMFNLAKSLAKIDGGLHIDKDLRLLAFGCLLDGRRVATEDCSRGARYNSALRFTYDQSQVIVIVVSADRPVSIIKDGKDISIPDNWQLDAGSKQPPLLRDWVVQS